jgi:hypothetical protein
VVDSAKEARIKSVFEAKLWTLTMLARIGQQL